MQKSYAIILSFWENEKVEKWRDVNRAKLTVIAVAKPSKSQKGQEGCHT